MGFFNKKKLYIMECIQRTLKKKEKKNTKPIFFSCIRIFAHLMKRTNIDFYY